MLRELHRTDRGVARPPYELAGLISVISVKRRTLTISADGPGLSSATIVMSVPRSIELKKFSVPEAIVARATVGADGTYTLTGADADTDATAANAPSSEVGDFKPEKHATRHRARATSHAAR
jgi:hypothetical protein